MSVMGYVWNKYGEIIGTTSGRDYTDYSAKATATHGGSHLASTPWKSSSSSGTKTSSSSKSKSKRSSNLIDTSVLSGMAKKFAEAYNKALSGGSSTSEALTAAEKATYGRTYEEIAGAASRGSPAPPTAAQNVAPGLTRDEILKLIEDVIAKFMPQYEPPVPPEYKPPEEPRLTWEAAQQRAEEMMNPLYQKALKELERRTNIDLERRGLSPALFGAALKQLREQELGNERTARIASLAQQLVNQSEEVARAREQQAYQNWLAQQEQAQRAWENWLNTQREAWGRVKTLLPYFLATEEFRQTLPLEYASTFGVMPETSSLGGGQEVELRSYLENQGIEIGYDPVTRMVTINGISYTPEQLQSMGGRLQNGRWYVPITVAAYLARGNSYGT